MAAPKDQHSLAPVDASHDCDPPFLARPYGLLVAPRADASGPDDQPELADDTHVLPTVRKEHLYDVTTISHIRVCRPVRASGLVVRAVQCTYSELSSRPHSITRWGCVMRTPFERMAGAGAEGSAGVRLAPCWTGGTICPLGVISQRKKGGRVSARPSQPFTNLAASVWRAPTLHLRCWGGHVQHLPRLALLITRRPSSFNSIPGSIRSPGAVDTRETA